MLEHTYHSILSGDFSLVQEEISELTDLTLVSLPSCQALALRIPVCLLAASAVVLAVVDADMLEIVILNMFFARLWRQHCNNYDSLFYLGKVKLNVSPGKTFMK